MIIPCTPGQRALFKVCACLTRSPPTKNKEKGCSRNPCAGYRPLCSFIHSSDPVARTPSSTYHLRPVPTLKRWQNPPQPGTRARANRSSRTPSPTHPLRPVPTFTRWQSPPQPGTRTRANRSACSLNVTRIRTIQYGTVDASSRHPLAVCGLRLLSQSEAATGRRRRRQCGTESPRKLVWFFHSFSLLYSCREKPQGLVDPALWHSLVFAWPQLMVPWNGVYGYG